MAEIKKTITGDLFKYFCEHEVKGTEEEIFSAWVWKAILLSDILRENTLRRTSYMEALERFYKEYLIDYAQDSNWERYDADAQMTRNRVEDILETGYISEDDLDFLRSLLPDIENDGIREDLEDFLNLCE